MSRSRKSRVPPLVRDGRRACTDAFEPLWRCAPYVFGRRGLSALDAANMKEAAKRTAFAWLSEKMGVPIDRFEDISDYMELRRAYSIIAPATIKTVQTWADAKEAAA